MTENRVKWVLFTVLSLFLPLFLAAPMAGNFYIPLALIAILSFKGWIMLLNLNPFAIFVLGQLVVYGFVIYFVSKYGAKRICKFEKIHSNVAVLVVILCLIFISFFPIYGFESGDNLYETYNNLLRI